MTKVIALQLDIEVNAFSALKSSTQATIITINPIPISLLIYYKIKRETHTHTHKDKIKTNFSATKETLKIFQLKLPKLISSCNCAYTGRGDTWTSGSWIVSWVSAVSVSPWEEKGTNFTNRGDDLRANGRKLEAESLVIMLLCRSGRQKGTEELTETPLLSSRGVSGAFNGGVLRTVAIEAQRTK